jgi:hypothetical protein
MKAPSIQKAWPDGQVETVVTQVDGIALQAPNDLSFGPDGRLFFTDPADYLPADRRPGRIFALNPDGTGECLEELPAADLEDADGVAGEDEAVAAKPTRDFDAKWVHPGNFVTGDTITRLAYQSLKGVRPPTTP